MPLRLALVASLAANLIPLHSAVIQGQLTSPPPQVTPGWYARTQQLNDPPRGDRAIMERNLAAAERLITSTTGYARPRGFEGRPHWASSSPAVPGGLRTYSTQVLVYVPAWGSARNPYATIFFNPELGQVSDGAVKNESGEYYYHERPRSPAAYGTKFVYGTFGVPNSSLLVLFTAHDQDPMLPVSREEYLRALIHQLDAGKSRAVQSAGSKTSYQAWMDGAEKRKADREKGLAALGPEAVEKARATLEKNDREYGEVLKKLETQEVADRRALTAADPAARLRDQLSAMTPQERASQAWAGGTELMPEAAPGALRVVRANPAFNRARTSPAEARSILVILREPPPALAAAQDLLHREFDWQALRALLDTRP